MDFDELDGAQEKKNEVRVLKTSSQFQLMIGNNELLSNTTEPNFSLGSGNLTALSPQIPGSSQTIVNLQLAGIARSNPPLLPRKIRVLIVDDNVFNIMSLSSILQQISQISLIDRAFNGKQCVDLIAEIVQSADTSRYYDVIFMDINMPEMDGFEASYKINQMKLQGLITWAPKIILLSAFMTAEDKKHAVSIGCSEYYSKPLGFQ